MLKKNLFGHDHEIMYDCVFNHDAYKYLQITLEVERGQNEEATIVFNDKLIGKIKAVKVKKTVVGYDAYRLTDGNFTNHGGGTFKELGKAVASVVSDFV